MTLPVSGAISFNAINVELGVAGTTTASLNQTSYRDLAGVPSGAISLSNFYGKSSIINKLVLLGGTTPSSSYSSTSMVYDLLSNTVVAGATFTGGSTGTSNGAGVSTPSYGVASQYSAGNVSSFSAVCGVYTYSSNTIATGATLSNPRTNAGATGNTTVGVWCNGGNGSYGSTFTNVTDVLTYSTSVATTGTALGTASLGLAATGNSTRGIYNLGNVGGTIVATTKKYTFSGNTVANGANLSTVRTQVSASGNTTVGLFVGGLTASSSAASQVADKYTYTTDANAASTLLPTGASQMGSGSNTTYGIFCGGYTGPAGGPYTNLATTNKFTWSSSAWSSGTALTTTLIASTPMCSSYGGLQ